MKPGHHIATDPLGELAEALRNVFKLAEEHKIHKIALPAIGTGVYGFSMIEAVRVYATVSRMFLGSETLEEIRFVFSEAEPMNMMTDQIRMPK